MACCSAAIEVSTNRHKVDNRICNILYANINGFKSKADNVNQIVVEQNIDIFFICETKVYTNYAVQIGGFQSFPVVRQKKAGGGLYIGIRYGLCESVLSEYGKNAEFITVRMNCKGQGLRLILVYGPQEKELEENRTEFYETLSIEIERCFLSGDSLILAADFNAKLGYDIITDDIHVMSPNGKLLHALMSLSTRTHDCQGRKESSVPDYVFVSTDLYQQVKSMLIDEQQLFTPWRKLKKGKRFSNQRAIKMGYSRKYPHTPYGRQ